jgi:hypothetical protein
VAAPTITFTTPAVGTALSTLGWYGYDVSGGAVVLWFGSRASGGGWSSSADSVSVTVNDGSLNLTQLQGSAGAAATATYTLTVSYDGTNAPFVISTSGTAPSVTRLTEQYRLHSVEIDYPTSQTLVVPASQASFNPSLNVAAQRTAGNLYPTHTAVMGGAPTLSFGTPALATALDVVGLGSLTSTQTTVYFAKLSGDGFAGSGHVSYQMNGALVVPDSINAQHNSVASINYTAYGIDSGSGAVTTSGSATLPTVASLDECFVGGKVAFDSNDYQTTGWSLSFGQNVDHGMTSGDAWPTYACITSRNVTANVTSLDVGLQDWEGASETSVVMYARKTDQASTRIADGTAQHVSLTFAEAFVHPQARAGTRGQAATETLMIQPTYDGTNNVVVVDTSTTIT